MPGPGNLSLDITLTFDTNFKTTFFWNLGCATKENLPILDARPKTQPPPP